MLEAGNQRDMAYRFPGRQRFEQVADHGRVDTDVLDLGVLAHPGGEEDVGRRYAGPRGGQAGRVEQVGGDRAHAIDIVCGPARQPVHAPALCEQFAREVAAADAAGADH